MTKAEARDYLEQYASRWAGTPWATLATRALAARAPKRGQGVVAVANRIRLLTDDELVEQLRLLRADARRHGDERLFRTCTRAIEGRSLRAIRTCAQILESNRARIAAELERDAQARNRRRGDTVLNQIQYEREHP